MRILKSLLITILTISMFTGCQTYQSYTFNLETEEQIKVELDTTGGEKLSQEDGRFIISSNEGEEVSIGLFYLGEPFNQLYNTVDKLEGVEIIEVQDKEQPEYIFYSAESESATEYNYLVKFDGTESGVVVSNITSEESAKAAFELLDFEVNQN